MEYSNASGLVVCIPTGGSVGIVPAVIHSAGEYYKADKKIITKELLAAGVIGVCMAKNNSFSGGKLGCQAEIGCAAAMASGALVQMMGGTPRQSCDASSLSLQSLLGLVCDPVAGLVQVPCMIRNMCAAATAVVSANAVITGFDAAIPFGEMCDALLKVGEIISPCKSIGATTTPTSLRLASEQEKRKLTARYI